ncbi:MAG: hypothetical protein AAF585_20210, partial [Verrucomicrobiota bacterium]
MMTRILTLTLFCSCWIAGSLNAEQILIIPDPGAPKVELKDGVEHPLKRASKLKREACMYCLPKIHHFFQVRDWCVHFLSRFSNTLHELCEDSRKNSS